MPLSDHADITVREMLSAIANGERIQPCVIGTFTALQFSDISRGRQGMGFEPLGSPEIIFIGRHLYASRARDGYTIDDMAKQIASSLSVAARVIMTRKMTCLQSVKARDDGYGNLVHDRSVFEMTARRPRAELFSVIPKGDIRKPP